MAKNIMQEIEIEKMVLHCGGTEDKLEKSVKLLEMITGGKIYNIQSTKRIPAFGISPGKKSGCKITLRNKEKIKEFQNYLENHFKNKSKNSALLDLALARFQLYKQELNTKLYKGYPIIVMNPNFLCER